MPQPYSTDTEIDRLNEHTPGVKYTGNIIDIYRQESIQKSSFCMNIPIVNC